LVFNPNSPFSIVSSDTVNYTDVQEMNRFARYWDLIGNSGRFKHSLSLLMGDSPFQQFSELAKSLFARTNQTHKISLLRLYDFVFDIATQDLNIPENSIREAIQQDFMLSGLKSIPKCLNGFAVKAHKPKSSQNHASRQSRH